MLYQFKKYQKSEILRNHLNMGATNPDGITIVVTYLFWIYHEETEGTFDFTGDRDIRKFIADAQRAELDVILRIGPWAHGECRNGGLPDRQYLFLYGN